jgi:hypothetical protein
MTRPRSWTSALATLALALAMGPACGDKPDDDDDDDNDDDSSGACPQYDLGSDVGPVLQTGSTESASDDYSYCGDNGSDSGEGEGARDVAIEWTAPSSDLYTVHTRGSSFDTVLTLLGGGCGGDIIECDDDGGMDLDSLITFDANGGETYLFVIDGYDSHEKGDWSISVVEGIPDWAQGDSGHWGDDTAVSSGSTSGSGGEPDTTGPPNVTLSWNENLLTLATSGGAGGWWFGVVESSEEASGRWTGEDCLWGFEAADGGMYSYCHDATDNGVTLLLGGDPANLQRGATALSPRQIERATYYLESDPLFGGDGSCWVWGADPGYYRGLGCTQL